jgi:hypothetical protein
VVGLAAGTGSAFSLLPAQNASGNWIKVVQRVPVRISLDAKELAAHPLRVGLSTAIPPYVFLALRKRCEPFVAEQRDAHPAQHDRRADQLDRRHRPLQHVHQPEMIDRHRRG